MSDGEVTRFVPLTLEASEQRVTESSLEEPATGMGFRRGKRQAASKSQRQEWVSGGESAKQPTNEYQRCEASGHDGGSLHVGQIFDL
jgi:hypothetical protein